MFEGDCKPSLRFSVRGVIGSHARLRIWCREAWGFESLYPHKRLSFGSRFFCADKGTRSACCASADLSMVGCCLLCKYSCLLCDCVWKEIFATSPINPDNLWLQQPFLLCSNLLWSFDSLDYLKWLWNGAGWFFVCGMVRLLCSYKAKKVPTRHSLTNSRWLVG